MTLWKKILIVGLALGSIPLIYNSQIESGRKIESSIKEKSLEVKLQEDSLRESKNKQILDYSFIELERYNELIATEFVENAKKYIGTPYNWGGRLTEKYPGLDCLGLLFLAHSETFGSEWYNFSTYPSKIIEKNRLGKPVKT